MYIGHAHEDIKILHMTGRTVLQYGNIFWHKLLCSKVIDIGSVVISEISNFFQFGFYGFLINFVITHIRTRVILLRQIIQSIGNKKISDQHTHFTVYEAGCVQSCNIARYVQNYDFFRGCLHVQLQLCFTRFSPRQGLLSLMYYQSSFLHLFTEPDSTFSEGAFQKLTDCCCY